MFGAKSYEVLFPVKGGTLGTVGTWFDDNFNFEKEYAASGLEQPNPSNPAVMNYPSRRTAVVTDNGVSNLIARPTLPSYAFGNYPQNAAKASLNTGDFLELGRAFFNVMAEKNGTTPYESVNGGQPTPPKSEQLYAYAGSRFSATSQPSTTQPVADENAVLAGGGAQLNQNETNFVAVIQDDHPQRMFRSSIRDNRDATVIGDQLAKWPTVTNSSRTIRFDGQNMMQLRAALAAANTISMRYGELNHELGQRDSVQKLQLNAQQVGTGGGLNVGAVDVYVYGVERQPYITEIYANTDTQHGIDDPSNPGTGLVNTEPYVAIEVFFPYPITRQAGAAVGTLGFGGWSLAVVDRTRNPNGTLGSVTPLIVDAARTTFDERPAPLGDGAYFLENTTPTPELGTYVIFENYKEDGSGPAKYRPLSSQLPVTGPIESIHNASVVFPPLKKVYVRDLGYVVHRVDSAGATINANGKPFTGGELVLFRPTPPQAQPWALNYTPPPDKPVDSFDFSGLIDDSQGRPNPLPGGPPLEARGHSWHYVRPGKSTSADVHGNFGRPWGMIYPGRYDGGYSERRHQGTQASSYKLAPTDAGGNPVAVEDPFDVFPGPDPQVTLGFSNNANPTDNASPGASYANRAYIQLLNGDQPGWNPLKRLLPADPPSLFPYGAFARASDAMQIPFFGSYRVRMPNDLTGPDIEINALPIDASFAEDTDLNDDEQRFLQSAGTYFLGDFEQLGRFCPIANLFALDPSDPANPKYRYDDLDVTPTTSYRYGLPAALNDPAWRYRWTTRLFDFITVQDPQSDYTPNVSPSVYSPSVVPPTINYVTTSGTGTILTSHAPVLINSFGNTPILASNEGSTPGGPAPAGQPNAENAVPVHGLININTVPWRILAALPLGSSYRRTDTPNRDKFTSVVDPATGQYSIQTTPGGAQPDTVDDLIQLAKCIAWWRDGINPPANATIGPHGPFHSIYDLYRVAAVQAYYNGMINSTNEPDDFDGDFSPYNPTISLGGKFVDERRNDYEERFLLLNRLSNLITTRSDTFTVYIVVQGWRNAGSTDTSKPPELVVQRRAAFIADRSAITASGGQLKVINIPTE